MTLRKYLEAPFGLDRRDSAVRKGNGILFELQNLMMDQGALYVRKGFDPLTTAIDAGSKILALHRFYGFNANTGAEIKELYAAVNNTLRRLDGTTWTQLALPPGVTLTADQQGEFRQLRDRTYYSNYTEPVLVIEKEDDQIYEAGIPSPDEEIVLADCESLTDWTFTTDGDSNYIRAYLDAGFERHTKGDYGITLEQHESGAIITATYDMGAATDLEWFFKSASGTADVQSSGGTKLYDSGAFTQAHVGQQIKNTTDGSTAVIVELISQHEVRTTELSGGTDDTWQNGDGYTIGVMSSEYDYIAMDIFRFTKIDIDAVYLELSSDSNFTNGFRAVIYADSDFEHFDLLQRTLLAEWAMNTYSNKLFFARFRKRWFVDISGTPDDWSTIRYVRVRMEQNSQSSLAGAARITIDNIRLLKTPPLPATKRLQVATCDAIETWSGAGVSDDFARATQGVSCKKITLGATGTYTFEGGVKDLSQYGEGTSVHGSDVFVFDITGTGGPTTTGFYVTITLIDSGARTAVGVFTPFNDMANLQQRHIYIQEFILQDGFDWTQVATMTVWNGGASGSGLPDLYIDNIRIEPASASKVINKFIPIDLIIADTINRGIEHYFGENSLVDAFSDILFHAYAKFTRQASGQGNFVYPEYQHGRYKLSNELAAASLQLTADAGGSFSMTFTQDTDLTEYEDWNFNLDAFLHPRQYEKSFLGVDWVEIPATENDEFKIWMSSPNWKDVHKVIFRFYANAEASWTPGSNTHDGVEGSKKLNNASYDFTGKLGKRIYNEDTGEWGIIGWIGGWELDGGTWKARSASAWGQGGHLTWSVGETFTVNAFGFGATGTKPKPDADNYWEYVIEPKMAFQPLRFLDKKARKNLSKYPIENQEIIEGFRSELQKEGLEQIYQEESGDKKWTSVVVTWKRKDMVAHNATANPWTSLQCIAAHSIILQASSKKSCTVNFQDWTMHKKGAVEGEVAYKILLEDEQGYLGPDSEDSKIVNTAGNEVQVSDLYVPYDTRIARKRLYRTDSTGVYRHLDTIDRLESSYLDNIPEEMLGEPIPEIFFKPPQAAIMEPVKNKMAYADIIDRDGRIRPSRIMVSKAFAPHQCSDDDVFDVLPENGQRLRGIRYYHGIYLVWKEKSFYTVDPDTFQWDQREENIGLVAKRSLSAIPDMGFGWLSHEGPVFGDHTNRNTELGALVWDDIKDYSLATLSQAVGFYYDDYYYLFVGETNQHGYALHIPTQSWWYIADWNVQCVVQLSSGTDLREVYAGSNYGYVNHLFEGNFDYTDDANNTQFAINSVIRTLDYDFQLPGNDKYPRWVLLQAKNLVSGPANQAQLVITPYLDQVAGSAYNSVTLDKLTYYQHIVEGRHPTIGNEKGTLLGMRMVGTGRYAIRDFMIDAGDLGFRPNLC